MESIQDIKREAWEILRETSRMFQESKKESDRRFAENAKSFQEYKEENKGIKYKLENYANILMKKDVESNSSIQREKENCYEKVSLV